MMELKKFKEMEKKERAVSTLTSVRFLSSWLNLISLILMVIAQLYIVYSVDAYSNVINHVSYLNNISISLNVTKLASNSTLLASNVAYMQYHSLSWYIVILLIVATIGVFVLWLVVLWVIDGLFREADNETLRERLQEAFIKAGYTNKDIVEYTNSKEALKGYWK